MKVLICHNDYQITGGESEVVDKELALLRALEGYHIETLRVHNDEIRSFSWIRKLLFPLDTVFNRRSFRTVTAILESFRPDIVHVHNVFPLLSPSVYFACLRRGIPIVQTIHNFRFFCPNGLLFRSGHPCELCSRGGLWHAVRHRCYRKDHLLSAIYAASIWWLRTRGVLDRIAAYITLTEFSRNKLMEFGISGERIHIKPNFLAGTSQFFAEGGYGLYIGRYSSEKGIVTIVRSLQGAGPFVFAGSGELEPDIIEASVRSRGSITVQGFVRGDEKQALLQGARYVVVASECYENLPTIILEAFQCGKPVIASRIGSIPFLVEHEQTGLLFEPGDSDGLRRAMERFNNDEAFRQTCGRRALEAFRSRFSADRQSGYFASIYASVLRTSTEHS